MKPVEIEFLVNNNTRQGLSKVSGGIDGVEKDATETKKSIQALEAEIARLQNVISQTPQMDQTENIRQIESLKRQLQALQATAQNTDLVPASAPKAVRSYNGLNMAIQQIIRESPSLAMGLQMYFLAVSNNYPILWDAIARTRAENELLAASGQKTIPVWRQILSSVGSFQTLLTVGITLAVAYGKEIGNFVSSLFRGEAAARTMADAQREVNETMIADAADYSKRVAAIRSLSAAWKTLGDDLETRKKFIEDNKSEFDKLGVSVGNVHDAENLLVTNTDAFVASLERRARAVAAQQLTAEQYKKSLEYEIKAQELENKAADVRKNEEIDMTAYAADTRFGARSASELAEERAKSFEDEAAQLRKLKAETDNYASSLLQIQRSEEEAGNKILENAGILSADTISGKAVGSGSVEPLLRQYAEAQRKFREEIDEQSVAQMEDGFAKERVTIRLNYEKKRREYETQEHETLALIKRLRTAGANIGSDAEKSVMAETDALVAGAVELRDQELAEVDRKETESFDKLLEKYETYQQGRLRIAREYDAEIAKLAANPENQEIARRAKQKALDDFTERFAEQFPEFETWSNRIITASVKKLDELLIEVQEKLENLQGEIPGDNNAIAVLQAAKQKIEKRRAELNAKKKEEEERAMDTTSWTELHRVLTDVVDTFNEVGEAIGGAAGEIISVAGKVSASTLQMVNAIQAYRTAKSNGNKLGMASGILGGISAGVSALTSIFSLFKGGETSLERNLRLAREFNEELRIMKERSKINSDIYDSIFGDRLYDRYRQNVEVVRTALDGLSETQEQIMTRGKEVFEPFSKGSTGLANLDKVAKTWETVADSVYNMQVQTRHSTWFRSAKYKSLGSLVPELFDDGELNMEALKEFVENGGDTFKHLSDANRELLQSLVDDWETYEEAIGAVNDYLQDIFGDLGNTLTDALVDAFENGTDAADSFVESVGQAMRKLAKDMIYSNTLGQVFEDAEKRFDEINRESYSDEERFSKWSEAMQQLMTDALGQQDEFNKLWAEFRRIAAESGISIDSMENTTQQSGKSGAMQTVSQESFSRVEGLVTSIQIHSANFDDNLEGIVPVLGQSLNALQTIAGHTGSLPQIYELLEAIRRDGLKVN